MNSNGCQSACFIKIEKLTMTDEPKESISQTEPEPVHSDKPDP